MPDATATELPMHNPILILVPFRMTKALPIECHRHEVVWGRADQIGNGLVLMQNQELIHVTNQRPIHLGGQRVVHNFAQRGFLRRLSFARFVRRMCQPSRSLQRVQQFG